MASSNPRIHPYLKPSVFAHLQAAKLKPGRTESDIVNQALAAFFSHEHDDKRDAALIRRLDRLSRQIEGLERKQIIAAEAFALFVRYFLTVIPQVSEADRKAAQAEGHARFETYLSSLQSILQDGEPILFNRVEDQLADGSKFFTEDELARLHEPRPERPAKTEDANGTA